MTLYLPRGVEVPVAKLKLRSQIKARALRAFFCLLLLCSSGSQRTDALNHNEQALITLVPDLSTDFEQLS